MQAGDTDKNDPGGALPVAVAALRSRTWRQVSAEDYPAVLTVWPKRHRDLARTRNQVACRLHAVLCELVPGGHPKQISAARSARILAQASPAGCRRAGPRRARRRCLGGLRHLGTQLHATRKKLAAAVKTSGTALTQVSGAGPVIAGTIIGDVSDVARFPTAPLAAYNGTAPAGVSSGNRKPAGCRCAAAGISTTRSTWPRSPSSGTSTARATPATTRKWPGERPTKKRCDPSSARSATPSSPRLQQAPAKPARTAREGNRGTALTPARPAHTPNASSSDQPLPDPTPPYGPPPQHTRLHRRSRPRRKLGQPLNNNSKEDSLWAFQPIASKS